MNTFKLTEQSVKILREIYGLLDQLSVVGYRNNSILSNVNMGFPQVFQDLNAKEETEETKEV